MSRRPVGLHLRLSPLSGSKRSRGDNTRSMMEAPLVAMALRRSRTGTRIEEFGPCRHRCGYGSVVTAAVMVLSSPLRLWFCCHCCGMVLLSLLRYGSVVTAAVMVLSSPLRLWFLRHRCGYGSVVTAAVMVLSSPLRFWFCRHRCGYGSVVTARCDYTSDVIAKVI